jgi:hypothetical protein
LRWYPFLVDNGDVCVFCCDDEKEVFWRRQGLMCVPVREQLLNEAQNKYTQGKAKLDQLSLTDQNLQSLLHTSSRAKHTMTT